jgi:predicted glycosyltransferase
LTAIWSLSPNRCIVASPPFGKVFISAEGKLPDEIKQYQIKSNPNNIHHLMYFSQIYIGDSQSMATEATLLGTPSIRFNTFVGEKDLNNFIFL